MVPNALQTSYGYVILPFLGFIVLLGLALISLPWGGSGRISCCYNLLGALVNADMAFLSILSDERLALRIDRAVHLFFVFSIPVYIRFVHSFWASGEAVAEVTALLFSTALLAVIPRFYFNGLHHCTSTDCQCRCTLSPLSAAGAFTVIYCLALLSRHEADRRQYRKPIKYILGLGAPPCSP